uniref:Uncharacterized protein n=1 Tax=Arundo donax TaxID=35708 RepID=A0A0A8ZPM1_ARUDO
MNKEKLWGYIFRRICLLFNRRSEFGLLFCIFIQ